MTGMLLDPKPTIVGKPMSKAEVETIKTLLKDMQPETSLTLTEPTCYGQLTHYWFSLPVNQGTWKSCMRVTVSEPMQQSS